MIIKLNLKDRKTLSEVIELQRTSYLVEAELIGCYDIPPLKDTIDTLTVCDETFYGYYVKEELAGIISYKVYDDVLDIHRVAIHPRYFRRGIAGELLHHVEGLDENIKIIKVCTGKKNQPAVNLYLTNGYKVEKDMEVEQGLILTMFHKALVK